MIGTDIVDKIFVNSSDALVVTTGVFSDESVENIGVVITFCESLSSRGATYLVVGFST